MLNGSVNLNTSAHTLVLHFYVAALSYYFSAGLTDLFSRTLSGALKRAGSSGVHLFDYQLFAYNATGSLITGDLDSAEVALQRASQSINHRTVFDVSYYHYARAWLSLLQNDLTLASFHIEQALKQAIKCEVDFNEALCHLLKAQVCHECKESREATRCIADARRIGERMKSFLIEYMCLLAEAQFVMDATLESGVGEEGITQCLRMAMALGREKGFMYHHGWRQGVMVRLCQRALDDAIEVEHVRRLIQTCSLAPVSSSDSSESWPRLIKIYTLGQFSLVKSNTVLSSKKTQHRPIDMLQLLITFGSEGISAPNITWQLWPEADGDRALDSFKSNLFRLRKLIGKHDAVQLQSGMISLNPQYVWADVWEFDRLYEAACGLFNGSKTAGDDHLKNAVQTDSFSSIAGAKESRDTQPEMTEALLLAEKAIRLYKGHFLPSHTEHAWVTSYRKRMQSKLRRLVVLQGRFWLRAKQWEKALACFQDGIEKDEQAEVFYWHLLLCYRRLARKAEATEIYRKYRAMLEANPGVTPSESIEELYKNPTGRNSHPL